ncbi:hypothetical protein PC9H_004424 [Pleurotus ostreatus]|uniref:Uncharacterized protein n=1 Tax=Pleurotus ostreatus TaxID=5322 RepID=A0A8H7A3T9_PLEOS|nr:uncharacterized protein PC9H_004424 [Pleurotus ostreatus]KAF7437582.1 hypothetical protein PC9H_004424 [Pleurotus ostreatus]
MLGAAHSRRRSSSTSTKRAVIIVASLEDSLMGASLQYSGTSYIARDAMLRARLEARLRKPEAECVIC